MGLLRFAVILYFFVHLAVLLKAPQLKWASRVVGYGIPLFFLGMIITGAEPNSNFVYGVTAVFAGLSVLAAEIVAGFYKKPSQKD